MEEPAKTTTESERPAPLGYATRIGEYPTVRRHPGAMVAVIVLSALTGLWSMLLGVMTLGDAWLIGLLLLGAGFCQTFATIGKMGAKGMRLGAAIVLLTLSIVFYVPTMAISQYRYNQQYQTYGKRLEIEHSDWQHTPTEAEHQVITYEMFEANAAVGLGLALICWLYAAARLYLPEVPQDRDEDLPR